MKLMALVLAGGLALTLITACSSSDTGTPGGTTGSSSGASGGTSGSSGTTSGDAGGDGAAKKADGDTCTVDADCMSDHCKAQGAGSGGGGGGGGGGTARAGSFCTIFCAMPMTSPAAECTAAIYTGKCSGKSFCEVK